ncbi:MAG: hypothetical protein AB4057_06530 [Crocosphaera sp.]
MAERLEFDLENNLYAYSVDSLIELCEQYPVAALRNITTEQIEQWLYEIGEIELCKIAQDIRTHPPTDAVDDLVKKFKKYLNNRKFIDILDINRAIDTTLKEYEALRAEILQNASEINQLILLGLAAIFTIVSIGLAPLSDFLTVEDTIIDMPLTLKDIGKIETIISTTDEEQEKQITKYINNEGFRIFNDNEKKEKNGKKDFLRITKITNGETIEKRGIVPSIIILNWLIPGLSLCLVYRSLSTVKKNRMIGTYIYHRVEKKLFNLGFLKKLHLGIEDNYINLTDIKHNNNSDPNNCDNKDDFKEHLAHISWQHYITREGTNYSDPLDASLIYVVFALISGVSFVGGSLLLIFNFDIDEWPWKNFRQEIIANNVNQVYSLLLAVVIISIIFFIFWKQINFLKQSFLSWCELIFTILYICFFAYTVPSFYSIPSDKLDNIQLWFLLIIPLIIYSIFIMLCWIQKCQVQQLIEPPKKRAFSKEYLKQIWDAPD